MKKMFKRLAPPGVNLKTQRNLFITGIGLAGGYSLFSFTVLLLAELELLYMWRGGRRVLDTTKVMEDFSEIVCVGLYGFGILAILTLTIIITNYVSYYQGSRSIYTMRRLPNPLERHWRCIALPILAIFAYAVLVFLLIALYYGIYCLATPDVCQPPQQWQKFWSVIL